MAEGALMSTVAVAPPTQRPAMAIGRPVAISGLARLLLRMHQQRPALHLVMPPRNDE